MYIKMPKCLLIWKGVSILLICYNTVIIVHKISITSILDMRTILDGLV
jgi:hypothetical protein